MIIPLNHENMHGRRWPYVTIGLIALNTIFFLATHGTIDRELHEIGEVQEHVLLLAATHSNTPMNAAEQKLVENFRRSQSKIWGLLPQPIARRSILGMYKCVTGPIRDAKK